MILWTRLLLWKDEQMSPLVQEMLEAVAGHDTELVFLEGLLEDDCKCESDHPRSKCSYKVTHIITVGCTPGQSWNVCENSAKATGNSNRCCAFCHVWPVADCWEIRPI